MAKISKKEISNKVVEAVNVALDQVDAPSVSKKTKKLVVKVSKKVTSQFKQDIKKQKKKAAKEAKAMAVKEKATKKKAQLNGQKAEVVLN